MSNKKIVRRAQPNGVERTGVSDSHAALVAKADDELFTGPLRRV